MLVVVARVLVTVLVKVSRERRGVDGTRVSAFPRIFHLLSCMLCFLSGMHQGQFRTTLQCPVCRTESSVYETFQYLPVPLPEVFGNFSFRVFLYLDPLE